MLAVQVRCQHNLVRLRGCFWAGRKQLASHHIQHGRDGEGPGLRHLFIIAREGLPWWSPLGSMTILFITQSWYWHLPLSPVRQDFPSFLGQEILSHLASWWCAALGTRSVAWRFFSWSGVCHQSHPVLGRLVKCAAFYFSQDTSVSFSRLLLLPPLDGIDCKDGCVPN